MFQDYYFLLVEIDIPSNSNVTIRAILKIIPKKMISHFTRNSDRNVPHPLRNSVSCHDCFGAYYGINCFLVPVSGEKNGQ